MHLRKMALAQQRLAENRQRITLKELLNDQEVKKLIVEFVTYMRVSQSISPFMLTVINANTLIEIQYNHYSQLLITNICALPLCKKNYCKRHTIEDLIRPLLKNLNLSTEENDEWTLHYFADFFSSHSFFKLTFYNSPLMAVKQKALPVCYNNPDTRKLLQKFSMKHPYQELKATLNFLKSNEVIKNTFSLYEKGQTTFVLSIYGMTWFTLFNCIQLLPPLLNENRMWYLNMVISAYYSFSLGLQIVNFIQYSPFHRDTISAIIQMGILNEIYNIVFVDHNPAKKKTFSENMMDELQQEKALLATQPKTLPSLAYSAHNDMTHHSSFTEEKSTQLERIKVKRKNTPDTEISPSPSFFQVFLCVLLRWEDSQFKPVVGVIRNNDIDFLFEQDDGMIIKRAWSWKPNINARCRYHLFMQPKRAASTLTPIETDFSEIISYGHVVPSIDYPGLVPIKKDDKDFPDAGYKAKSFKFPQYRIGLFFKTCSKSIEVLGECKQSLPKSLENKKFYLHMPGRITKTH